MKLKDILKKIVILKLIVISFRAVKCRPSVFRKIYHLIDFFVDYNKFSKLPQNVSYKFSLPDLFPRIYDKTSLTGIDPIYFLQGTWCAKKIFENKPIKHVDIGSQALMVGIISQSVPTTMVDIRPLYVKLSGLSFVKGDITHLPFPDNSIESLSSICVIEHIGLGRYGDPLDPFGTEKSIKELIRILKKDGSLYISVPIDNESKIYFNAHRAFSRTHILNLFKDLTLREEKYIYGNDMFNNYDTTKGFGTGLYHFKK